MILQDWYNIVSIISSTITSLSILGGVIFGGKKLRDFVNLKKKDIAFSTAIALLDNVTHLRDKHIKIKITLNMILNVLHQSYAEQKPINAQDYFKIQEITSECLDASFLVTKSFVKMNSFDIFFKNEAWEIFQGVLKSANDSASVLSKILSHILSISNARIITQEDINNVQRQCDSFKELSLQYSQKASQFTLLKFNDIYNFK